MGVLAVTPRTLENQAIEKGRRILAEIWAERKQEYWEEADVIRNSVRRLDQLAADFATTNGSEA
jgi:hypothetical protein